MPSDEANVDIDQLGQLAYGGLCSDVINALNSNQDLAHRRDKSGRMVIHWAAAGGHCDLVKLVVNKYHVDPDVADDVGWTPLIIASSAGRDEIVAYLLECSGVQKNAVNSTGQCALHYAASKDRFKIAEMLLSKGANPNVVDQQGSAPLHRSSSKGNTTIGKLLLSFGAEPTLRDAAGNTPLHLACEEDREQDVRLLLSSGADATATNKDEKTPYDVASVNVQHLLKNLGAVERT